ncbi:hypothetical protein [Actinophytocola sp.]|uniref:hypothetical protein n=1 Tax=Actinophytocola sp. TaxID=1872138 RepID=UPI00389A988A
MTTKVALREAIRFDGFATLPSGVLVAALAGVLADPLGIPTGVLIGAGLFFIAWGAGVLYLGARPVIDRRTGAAVGTVNAVCAVDGVVVALVADLTTLGTIVLLVLSVLVAGIGALQLLAARR